MFMIDERILKESYLKYCNIRIHLHTNASFGFYVWRYIMCRRFCPKWLNESFIYSFISTCKNGRCINIFIWKGWIIMSVRIKIQRIIELITGCRNRSSLLKWQPSFLNLHCVTYEPSYKDEVSGPNMNRSLLKENVLDLIHNFYKRDLVTIQEDNLVNSLWHHSFVTRRSRRGPPFV